MRFFYNASRRGAAVSMHRIAAPQLGQAKNGADPRVAVPCRQIRVAVVRRCPSDHTEQARKRRGRRRPGMSTRRRPAVFGAALQANGFGGKRQVSGPCCAIAERARFARCGRSRMPPVSIRRPAGLGRPGGSSLPSKFTRLPCVTSLWWRRSAQAVVRSGVHRARHPKIAPGRSEQAPRPELGRCGVTGTLRRELLDRISMLSEQHLTIC